MGFMGDAVMKRFEIKNIIQSIDGIREGTESFPDLSGLWNQCVKRKMGEGVACFFNFVLHVLVTLYTGPVHCTGYTGDFSFRK